MSAARSVKAERGRGGGAPGALALTLGCLAMAGCAADAPTPQPAPAPDRLQGAVLILLDTVRADHVSCYGYERPTTPVIDSLAADGVRFETVVSYSPWTLPSVRGLLGGEYMPELDGRLQRRSLVEDLAGAGWATAGFTEGGFVSRVFGLDRGFVDYEEEEGAVRLTKEGTRPTGTATGGIERTFERATRWLRDHRDERFFLFVHTYEPHTPYTRHDFAEGMDPGPIGPSFEIDLVKKVRSGEVTLRPDDVRYAEALYDGDIRNADRHVGGLLSVLRELGLDDRTLVMVVSDHGEEFGRHFEARIGDHGHSLYDPLILVPLVVFDPLGRYPVSRVDAQVRLVDVMPTILDLLGVAAPESIDGRSLVPLMEGTDSGDRPALLGGTRRGPARIGVRSAGFKYLLTIGPGPENEEPLRPEPEARRLFDLSRDPEERHNLVEVRPELASEMYDFLVRHHPRSSRQAEAAPEADVDSELMERLRSLGYVD